MAPTVRMLLALTCLLLGGCAAGSHAPNPIQAQLRQQLLLQSVVVTSTSNASAGEDTTTLASVKSKLKSKLDRSLAPGLKGTRPVRVEVEITRLSVDGRLLSVTAISTATVSVVDVATGKALASYRAGHEAPLGRAAMVAIATDDFVTDGLAASVTNHILSDHAQVDRAIPNAAGGVLGQVL